MKIKLKHLNPNPYREKGFDKEILDKIRDNIKELGLMGAFPVVKIKDKYYLVSHHHRWKVMTEEYGQDHEAECILHNYTDEQMLRGCVVENLTQDLPFHRKKLEILKIEHYLNKNPIKLEVIRTSQITSKGAGSRTDLKEKATAKDIMRWLKINKQDYSYDEINNIITIAKNLDETLQKQVEKTHTGKTEGRRKGGVISFTQARLLATIKNKQEQKQMAKVLSESGETRVREQSKLLAKYKKAPKELQEKIRKGKTQFEALQWAVPDKDQTKLPKELYEKKPIDHLLALDQARQKLHETLEYIKEEGLVQKIPLKYLTNSVYGMIHLVRDDIKPFVKEVIDKDIKHNGGMPNEKWEHKDSSFDLRN